MPAQVVILKAAGLQTSSNDLERLDGALIEAKNVIIKRENIVEQRRGYKLYGSELPLTNERVKQLTSYRSRLIRHYADKLQFDSNGLGSFLDFSGSVVETEPGLRIKFIESNGNLYFTTADGIKKISAKTAADFSTLENVITSAGAVRAVDVDGEIIYTPNLQTGFLPQDGAVAYRVVWAYKDINGNLVQGAPSQREVVGNPMINLILRDYTRLLDTLDNLENTPLTSARINDKNYVQTLGVTLNSSPSDLRTSLISLAAKLDNDIFLADQGGVTPLQISTAAIASGTLTITFTGGDPSTYMTPGSRIFLAGFSPATGTLNGAQTVVTTTATTITINTTATGAVTLASPTIRYNEFRSITQPAAPSIPATNQELVDIQTYLEDILVELSAQPVTIISASDMPDIQNLDVTTSSTVRLTITIPQGINSNYFYQVYRSSVSQATGAASFEDVVPSDELQLVYEAFPTPEEIEAGQIVLEDVTPDAFRGANLYTNNSTGEGILQSNDPPPFAKDINRYRNSVFYANTRTVQSTSLNLLGITNMIADFDAGEIPKVTITNGTVTNTYNFITGQQEITEVTTVADVANSLNSKYFLLNSLDTGYYVYFETTTAIDPAVPDRTGIKVIIPTGATADQVAQALRNKLSTYLDQFIVTVAANVVEIVNFESGEAPDSTDVDTGFTIVNTQQGRGERVQPQITEIQAIPATSFTAIGPSDYFEANTTLDRIRYYVWFSTGASTDPVVPGRIGLKITLTGTETAADVAQLIADILPSEQFETEVNGSIVTVTNTQYGYTSNWTEVVADPTFTVDTTQLGALDVLLSPLVSPARAVDETARSFVRVINKNPGDSVYAYYLSSTFDVPGKMLLQARTLQDSAPFYILANNDNTGLSFNPDIGPEGYITSITASNPTVITVDTPHGMLTGDQVVLSSTNSVPSMDGLFTVNVISPTSFSIPQYVATPGTEGSFIRAINALYSENEERSNRVYFSKYQQPEAVPLVNYFDVGAQDKAILRIVPLRDSLFVFKEDGLYRISGETAPFQLELFDSSYITIAPDSAAISNNVIYAWTTQGIQALTEGGSAVISRNIDDIILKIQSSNYPNFKTATWALGYESDNSYIVFTVDERTDTVAQIGYRYSTLTETWTTYDMSHQAGVIHPTDDKMYLAATDVAYIEQERKTFSRLDYTDRELPSIIGNDFLLKDTIILPSVLGFEVGDVVVQDQTITVFQYNTMLQKLDMDSGVADSDYFATQAIKAGSNPRTSLLSLAQKLDADPGIAYNQFYTNISDLNGTISDISENTSTIITSANHGLVTGRVVLIDSSDSSPSINGTHTITVLDANRFTIPVNVIIGGTAGNWQTVGSNFEDMKISYNFIMNTLNNDTGVSFNNYAIINNNTIQESIITGINRITKKVTLNLSLEYLVGDITIFKAFESTFTYSATTMGDPLNHKHLREATIMFETRNITSGTLSFRTDLLPEFIPVPFKLDGNGIFGHSPFGSGFFGGLSNSAPMRTYIPRQCQRCRYVIVKFSHKIAREDYRVNGITITGEAGLSSRAFR